MSPLNEPLLKPRDETSQSAETQSTELTVNTESSSHARFQRYLRYFEVPELIENALIVPNWLADGSGFWFVDRSSAEIMAWTVDCESNSCEPLFDRERLRAQLASVLNTELASIGFRLDDLRYEEGEASIRFRVDGQELRLDLGSYALSPVPPETTGDDDRLKARLVRKATGGVEVREVPSPDGRWFVGVSEHNLYVRPSDGGPLQLLTSDGVQGYEWTVQGNDWIPAWLTSAQWSPDARKIATTKIDARETHDVTRIPIAHLLEHGEELEWVPYARAGEPMAQSDVLIVDIATKRSVRVDVDTRDHVIGLLGWLPGGQFLFLSATRDLTTRALHAADSTTGASRLVFSDTAQGLFSPFNLPGVWILPSGEGFIWWSDRDGWGRLYRYDMNGMLRAQLTRRELPVIGGRSGVVEVDEEQGWVYFTAPSEQSDAEIHFYRVDFDGGNLTRLTADDGCHSVQMSPSRKFILDTHSTFSRPPRVDLRRSDGAHVRTVTTADISALADLHWTPPEEFVVTAADGQTELHGVIFKPYDFDPAHKYPVIDAIYGAPTVKAVHRTFVDQLNGGIAREPAQALAQLGFITVVIDGRGTAVRSAEFQNAVYRQVGRLEIPDHAEALRQLSTERTFMDMSRVGIVGWSWGGYLTIRGMLLASDLYRVGVALNAGGDLLDLRAGTIEPFMGVPEDNAGGYKYASNLLLADRLQGRLLLVHGVCDMSVPVSATMKLVDAFIRADRRIDVLLLPGEGHALTPAGWAYYRKLQGQYFIDHLRSGA